MRKFLQLLMTGLFLASASCAKIVTPVGGPKDQIPPAILKEQPENKSVNFNKNSIKITFDEFITLNNPVDNIFFSPPLQHTPDYSISGKSLIIKLHDTLKENITYNVVFSNAIKDFREGNPIAFYQYAFSTGSLLDTFAIEGKIVQADNLQALANIHIMLYKENIDSLPLLQKPYYVTKSQADGSFSFKHIAAGNYKIFALKDINGNLLYDLPNEGIAFSDTLILVSEQPTLPVQLLLFTQTDTAQKLLETHNPQAKIYQFVFKQPLKNLKTRFLRNDSIPEYKRYIHPNKDTLSLFFKENLFIPISLELTVDSIYKDTVILTPFKTTQGRERGGKAKQAEPLIVKYSNAGNIFKPLTLLFFKPIQAVDSFSVMLITQKRSGTDSCLLYFSVPDSILFSLPLPFKMEEKMPYSLIIADSVFTGFDGTKNDSIIIKFNSGSEKDFGNLSINYQIPPSSSCLIFLMNTQEKIIETHSITKSQTIHYLHLKPGDYKIKVIEDINRNGKWDSGNYLQHKQAERVTYFPKTLTIRGFWDMEEVFEVKFRD